MKQEIWKINERVDKRNCGKEGKDKKSKEKENRKSIRYLKKRTEREKDVKLKISICEGNNKIEENE